MILRFTFKIRWLILLITTINIISGCKESTYNGRYCADVQYYNPNSGTSSDYKLIVTVSDNQLVKLDFPQGYLSDEDLPVSTFSTDGESNLTLSNGYKYSIHISGPESGCFDGVTKPTQCKGTTKKGKRCKKLTDNANGLCHIHKNQ